MPIVLLLTCDELPVPESDTPKIVAALTEIGIDVRVLSWSDPETVKLPADLVVIRTTWDYTKALLPFLDTLRSLQPALHNPLSVVRWNAHKGYLIELAAANVPVVQTLLVSRGPVAVMPDLHFHPMPTEIIIKPAIAAGATGVGRFAVNDPAALLHLRTCADSADALIQPFVGGIHDGERSLIFFDGAFSHAVRKVPADSDFRVQSEYGGQVHEHLPTAAELRVARAAISCAPGELLYARVDLVNSTAGPQVMELELIEPELFIGACPGSAARFAAAIAAHLPDPAPSGVHRVG